MACTQLNQAIQIGISDMKQGKAPDFIISEYVEEMNAGMASMCQDCSKYEECWKE